jgi:SAM-dependent methyltransferase
MYDLEVELDRFLKIKTNGRDDSVSTPINYPYEATPYSVLQTLANSGYISKRDKIIDFGCGKGRVDFYLAYSVKAKMIGVEFDPRLYNSALKNSQTAISSARVSFVNCDACDYVIDFDVTGAYFFNPFNLEVLECVINNLRRSKNENDREIKLFFYYISLPYMKYLFTQSDITFVENIECMDQFEEYDDRESIAIFKL